MDAPSSGVLDCCEEAFLFDLAREDVWVYRDGEVSSPSRPAAASVAGASSASFSSYEAAQHRRVAVVEWATLQVLLRHASRSCAGLNNSHEMDNFIVTNLLDAKPLTASAVVAARGRFVGKRVPTRDLVRMVTRAGPLVPSARDDLKRVFRTLLTLETAMAAVVKMETAARRTVTVAEAAAWRTVASTERRAAQRWRYERMLQQQEQTAQQLVIAAHTRVPTAVVEHEEGTAVTPVEVKRTVEHDSTVAGYDSERVAYLNDVIAGQLHRSQAEVVLMREAVRATTTTLQSPAWCYEPMQRAIDAYANRLDARVASVAATVATTRTSVRQLCRAQAGRRLLRWLSTAHTRGPLRSPHKTMSHDAVSSLPSFPDALQEMRRWAQLADAPQKAKMEVLTASEAVVDGVFVSVARLNEAAQADVENTASPIAEKAVRPLRLDFPVFDYFAEFCDVYPTSACVDTRWRLFTSYATPVHDRDAGDAVTTAQRRSSFAPPWFCSHSMHRDAFGDFLRDWASGAGVFLNVPCEEEKLKFFLLEIMLPRWVTSPVFQQ